MKTTILLSLLCAAGCAHLSQGPHTPITYSCSLEKEVCDLVAAAARGRAVRDDAQGNLHFTPAARRTVFTGREIPTVGNLPIIAPELLPCTPRMERHGSVIEVTVLRGGLQRDGDIVADFVDIFSRTLP
jgi:hypothetical protein